jgi:hypothetical protein
MRVTTPQPGAAVTAIAAVIAVIVATASLAVAQTPPPAGQPPNEPGKWGLTIGYPGSFGVIYQPTQRLALRPDVTFGYSGSGTDSDTYSAHQWRLGTGISALIYLRPERPFRVYVSPSYSYRRVSQTSTQVTSVPSFDNGVFTITRRSIETTTHNNQHGIAGALGVEYRVTDDLGFFAEGGVQYRRLRLTTDGPSGFITDGRTVGDVHSVGGVGVAVYF